MDATAALWRFFLQILGIQYSHRMVSQGLVDSSSVWWLRSLPLAGIGWKLWLVELITRPSGWFAWDDLWRVFLCGNKDISVCFQSNFPRIWWYINYIYIYTHRYICIYNPRQKRGPLSWIYWIIESVNETLPFFQKKNMGLFHLGQVNLYNLKEKFLVGPERWKLVEMGFLWLSRKRTLRSSGKVDVVIRCFNVENGKQLLFVLLVLWCWPASSMALNLSWSIEIHSVHWRGVISQLAVICNFLIKKSGCVWNLDAIHLTFPIKIRMVLRKLFEGSQILRHIDFDPVEDDLGCVSSVPKKEDHVMGVLRDGAKEGGSDSQAFLCVDAWI